MTVEQFDNLELKLNDRVQIIMNDGSMFNEILYSGNAYKGRGEYINYLSKQVIPADPSKILIIGNNIQGFAEFILLDDVETVLLLE